MTATTFAVHDPDPVVLGLTKTFKSGAAILRGQVVSFEASGDDLEVIPATTATGTAIGVAAASATAAGEFINVYMDGCVVTVQEDTCEGTVDAGDWLMVGAVAGTVAVFDPAIGGHAATLSAQGTAPIGLALRNMVASTTVGAKVQMLVKALPMFTASS